MLRDLTIIKALQVRSHDETLHVGLSRWVVAMKTKTLSKDDWQSVLHRTSKIDTKTAASIIVSGPNIGAQTEADDIPFYGLS